MSLDVLVLSFKHLPVSFGASCWMSVGDVSASFRLVPVLGSVLLQPGDWEEVQLEDWKLQVHISVLSPSVSPLPTRRLSVKSKGQSSSNQGTGRSSKCYTSSSQETENSKYITVKCQSLGQNPPSRELGGQDVLCEVHV